MEAKTSFRILPLFAECDRQTRAICARGAALACAGQAAFDNALDAPVRRFPLCRTAAGADPRSPNPGTSPRSDIRKAPSNGRNPQDAGRPLRDGSGRKAPVRRAAAFCRARAGRIGPGSGQQSSRHLGLTERSPSDGEKSPKSEDYPPPTRHVAIGGRWRPGVLPTQQGDTPLRLSDFGDFSPFGGALSVKPALTRTGVCRISGRAFPGRAPGKAFSA